MTVITSFKFDEFLSPVYPLAKRIADMQASVPEFTIRTFSTAGTISQISSAISVSMAVGAPNDVVLSVALSVFQQLEDDNVP